MLSLIATLLILAGAIFILVGAIGVLIAGFRESVLWGLGMLFLGVVTLIFVILHWNRARGSVFIWLYGVVAVIAGLILADNNLPWPLG